MSSAPERLRDAVRGVQTWLVDHPSPGEAVVRQAIVLRLLHAAGFDIWNPAEVVPEETNATGNRADFLIRIGAGKFALELKGMGVTLGPRDFQQAATYAVNEGARWAIVTNGRVWMAIDEHLPGRWEERVALKLELGQEGHTFADDLAALLDVQTWRENAFDRAVELVRRRQQQRLDEARIRREKTTVVQAVMDEFQIPTFEKAALAAAAMNRITQAERDVLLGHGAPNATVIEREHSEGSPPSSIEFTLKSRNAFARIVFDRERGLWIMCAGSTARNRAAGTVQGKQALTRRRARMIERGQLELIGDVLHYREDVPYTSPSTAAMDICGDPKNGWQVWKDAQGRPAQEYRSGETLT